MKVYRLLLAGSFDYYLSKNSKRTEQRRRKRREKKKPSVSHSFAITTVCVPVSKLLNINALTRVLFHLFG